MNTTTTPTDGDSFATESEDFKRGYRAGIKYMERMDDEIALLGRIFGAKEDEDLSPRQMKMLRPPSSLTSADSLLQNRRRPRLLHSLAWSA